MCLPTSSEGPIEVVEAQTVMKMLPNCIPMSQKQIGRESDNQDLM